MFTMDWLRALLHIPLFGTHSEKHGHLLCRGKALWRVSNRKPNASVQKHMSISTELNGQNQCGSGDVNPICN